MSDLLRENGLHRLQSARRATYFLLADIPVERWCHQPVPGGNHVLWTLGHLANTDAFFFSKLTGQDPGLPAEWTELFGSGSQPRPSLDGYPPPEAVQEVFDRRRQSLLDWFGGLDPDRLESLAPDDLQRFGRNHADLMPSLAWHEGWHTGQISVVRRSLGLPTKFV